MPDRKTKALFVFRKGRAHLLERWRGSLAPDDMLYGYNHLDPARFDPRFIEPDEDQDYWQKRLLRPWENRLASRVGIGFFLDFALANLAALKWAQVILTTVDTVGLPVALLKRLGIINARVVYISQGLSDRLQTPPSYSRSAKLARRWYPKLLAACHQVLTLGPGAARHLEEVCGWDQGGVDSVSFGVDQDFWQPAPGQERENYVLSVGSDLGRDYPTLLAALDGQHLKLVTRQKVDASQAPGQVEVGSDFTDVQLRELYQKAACAVTPLRDVAQPSGQSATLQAMACGQAVIVTRTRGLWDPELMIHGRNCLLVPPEDPGALGRAIKRLAGDRDLARSLGAEARRTVERHLSSRCMARAVENILESALV